MEGEWLQPQPPHANFLPSHATPPTRANGHQPAIGTQPCAPMQSSKAAALPRPCNPCPTHMAQLLLYFSLQSLVGGARADMALSLKVELTGLPVIYFVLRAWHGMARVRAGPGKHSRRCVCADRVRPFPQRMAEENCAWAHGNASDERRLLLLLTLHMAHLPVGKYGVFFSYIYIS